ncbi:MAG: hypothetical protein MAG551_00007 [Candidatus Scalindua arabica]|uniref:Uncharacterized protein n=1 Tax=Candidatus Scalindua arabica TaxID=1127984 RepID=A0A941VZG1_9BACT|nr:hypothetical protein [Candidatus Scalindua arabica]
MTNIKLTISIILLFLTLPGCLARYGKDRLDQLLSSVKDLEENGEELTEEKIKEKLGKPGFLKPIYEHNLNSSSLYNLKKDSGVLLIPNRTDLYDDMLTVVKKERSSNIKLLSYVYDRRGLLELSSLTFYMESFGGTGQDEPKVFGWDYVKYGNKNNSKVNRQTYINYKIKKPTDYLRLPYTFLIDTVIGLKQFTGEIIKSPISFVEAELLENIFIEKKIPFYKLDGFRAAGEDWRNGITALTYRYRVDGKQGLLATTQNLLGEIPVIGSVFDQRHRDKNGTANKLFLTRGIYGGDDSAQNMDLWVHYLTNSPAQGYPSDMPTSRPGSTNPEKTNRTNTNNSLVKVIPYRYGSGIDVFWALFNISHGYAYDMAAEIISKYDVNPGDSIHLSGHSGGVQRSIATARILNDDGIKVEKIYGIAGPALGYAPSRKTKVVLNSKFLYDPVSEISRLLRYLTLDLLTLNIDWNDDICNNSRKEDEFYKHITPGFVDGRTRLKYDGYLNACLTDFLK